MPQSETTLNCSPAVGDPEQVSKESPLGKELLGQFIIFVLKSGPFSL